MDTATEPTIGTLTKQDLQALRQADRVSFHHTRGKGGCIVATKELRQRGPFDERERKYEIAVPCSFSGPYGREGERDKVHAAPDTVTCFDMIHGAEYSEEWQAVCAFLRPGDQVSLHWTADGLSNGYLRAARIQEGNDVSNVGQRLHGDILRLVVKRGPKRFAFHLCTGVCPDNTARMIRFA